MIFRRLTPDDAPEWRQFRLYMLRAQPEAFASTYAEVAARSLEHIAGSLVDVHMFAAIDVEIVGTVGWHRFEGPSQSHRGHVIAVYLHPDYRGQGVMDQLFSLLACDAITDVVQLELDVLADNLPAIRAYERNGFAVIGRVPRAICRKGVYYDDVHMVRHLDT